MGALHAWCLAAERPELVRALVVEDMAPDFRGRTTGPWEPWLHALPVEFDSAEQVFDEFGPVAGQYFLEAFDRTETGWRLHGHTARWIEIAAEWGTRDYWAQWRAVRAPALLIEAGNSVTPPGQMREMDENRLPTTYLKVPEAGHLVHDEAPQAVPRGGRVVSRGAASAGLTGYSSPASANRPSRVCVTRPSASSESSARSRWAVSVSHATSSSARVTGESLARNTSSSRPRT